MPKKKYGIRLTYEELPHHTSEHAYILDRWFSTDKERNKLYKMYQEEQEKYEIIAPDEIEKI